MRNKNTLTLNAPSRAISVILAGGRGNRLMSLTDKQAKPAVPFGGTFRIVDFTLSNCLNSGFRRIHVLTQYQSEGLNGYLADGWQNFLKNDRTEYIDILSADASKGQVFKGTADAVYQSLPSLAHHEADWVLILAGDHIYKMDYAEMLQEHIATGADLTIPCIEVPRLSATGFGVMKVNDENRIVEFLEKPADPPGIPGQPEIALASMGIYIFNRKFLEKVLTEDAADEESSHDFGTDIVPRLVRSARVMAHRFSDSCVRGPRDKESYWRDVGTVDAYWQANMDMANDNPVIDVNDPHWPIMTGRQRLPPPQFIGDRHHGDAEQSIIGKGCIIGDAHIRKSLLSEKVHILKNADIYESVLLPEVTVGRNVSLKKAIVERGCHLPDGLIVGADAAEDARRFYRTGNGVVLINRAMLNNLM